MHDSLTIALLQAREAAMTYFRPIVKSHNLTDQQWRIVRILADSPSMDFHELAFRTCILRPSLTGILTRMERDGLVLRLKPVNDQRKLYVMLTEQGQTLYHSILTFPRRRHGNPLPLTTLTAIAFYSSSSTFI